MFKEIAIRQYHEAFLCVILPYKSRFNIHFNNILQNHAESSQAAYSFQAFNRHLRNTENWYIYTVLDSDEILFQYCPALKDFFFH
jgi:hypothetical protein